MKRLLAIILSALMIHMPTAMAMGETPPANCVEKQCPQPEKPAITDEAPLRLVKGHTYYLTKDGWFFTDAQEQKLRLRLIDADFLQKQLQFTEQNVEHYKALYQDEQKVADKYHSAWLDTEKQLTETLKREGRTKLWYFLGGVLLTLGAGVAIGYAAKAVK